MKKLEKLIEKIMPVDRFLITVFAFMFNSLVYSGAREIAGGWKHHLLVSAVDKNIPFIPESLIIYFGCYIFGVWNYVLIAKLDKERAYRFYFADFFSRVICFAIFLLFPTTNIRPEITGSGFWEQGMRFLYYIDKADNLFPSIHCLISWFCYIGIRKVDAVPKWYQRFSCVFAVLVFVSTLTTKQHVIWDVAGGVLLAEMTFFIANHTNTYLYYENLWRKVTQVLFGKKGKQHERCEKECM